MRRILVDHARARNAVKRGGGRAKASAVDLADLIARGDPDEILALDEALLRLEAAEPEVAEAGATRPEVSESGAQVFTAPPRTARGLDEQSFLKGVAVGAGLVLLGVLAGRVSARP